MPKNSTIYVYHHHQSLRIIKLEKKKATYTHSIYLL
jgi:hypothetical protein